MEVAAGRQVFFQTRRWHGCIMHFGGGSGISWTAGVLASALLAVIPPTSGWFVGLLIFAGGRELNVPVLIGLGLMVGVVTLYKRGRVACFLSGLALGGLWIGGWMLDALESRILDCAVGVDQVLDLSIERVQVLGADARIEGRVSNAELAIMSTKRGARPDESCSVLPGQRLRLYWRGAPVLITGDRVAVTVRVKPPQGFANPGGFDYERWLFGAGLDGTGYVRRGELAARGRVNWSGRFRELAATRIERMEQLRYRGVMLAVTTGNSSLVSAESWRVFRHTGTIHLMVISGLHVALVAGFGAFLVGGVLRLMPVLLLQVPVRHAAWLVGLVLAFLYATVAGWDAPVMRAWLMALVGVLAWYLRNRLSPFSAWYAAALAALLVNPLGLFHQGVWLSFFVVLLMLQFLGPNRSGRRTRVGRWLGMLLAVQVLVTLGMMPMLAAWGLPLSTSSAIANLVAVPVVSGLVVPGSLFGVALTVIDLPGSGALGVVVLELVDQILGLLMMWLDWCADAPMLWAAYADADTYSGRVWLPWVALVAFWLLLRATQRLDGWSLVGVWCALVLPVDNRPAAGEVSVWALDVGQGSSVLVKTRSHDLLFDTGARAASGFDLGEAVVVPSLRTLGVMGLDRLIISHGDLDHAGGRDAVVAAFPPELEFAGAGAENGMPCVGATGGLASSGRLRADGQSWIWDGVTFEMLHPPPDWQGAARNDGSCVLLITGTKDRVLLAGDIGRRVEFSLANRADIALDDIDLIVAPHHGSASSSSESFLRLIQPRYVVFQAGRHNRFGHPHPTVLRRYSAVGADSFITGGAGAVYYRSGRAPVVWRSVAPAVWRRHPLR